MKIQTRKRLCAMLGAIIMLFCFVAPAFAVTTTISDDDNPYDFFQYLGSDSAWHDLNTPYHKDNSTGNWAYCIQHEKDPPSSSTQYDEVDASAIFSGSTIKGIQAILDHGYPSSSGGLSAAKAHYATANAIRAWIRESAGQGYNFMDVSRNHIRAKSGAEDVWAFFLELLGYARSGSTLGGGSAGKITVSPRDPQWSLIGGQLVAQVSISTTNGYTMSASTNQINVSGYTGGTRDTLTIIAPTSLMGTDVSLYFQTPSSGGGVTLYWYEPSSSSKQAVVVTEVSTGGSGQSTSVTITGEFYDLQVNKRDGYTGAELDGATFQLRDSSGVVGLQQTGAGRYAAGGSQSTFTTNNGSALIEMLPSGSYQVVEMSAPSSGYVVSAAKAIQLFSNSSVTIDNTPTRIELDKKNALTGASMPNLQFSLLDGSNNPVPVSKHADGTYRPASSGSNDFTLDASGKAVFLYFPNGTYRFKEASMPGYAELTGNSVTLNGTASITLENDPLTLLLTKVDSYTGAAMPNVPFELLDSAGNLVMLKQTADGVYHYDATSTSNAFTTGADGTATIHYIPAGNYILRESGAASGGYAVKTDANVNVSIKNGSKNAATVRFTNDPITLEFTKTDAVTKLALDGGTFLLKDEGGNVVNLRQIEAGSYRPDNAGDATFTTKNGKASIRYLPAGKYTVEEVTAPDGYKPDVIKTVIVTDRNDASNPAKVGMEDEPLSIEFTKTDKMTVKKMDGAQFTLKDDDGNIVKLKKVRDGVYTPDSSGADSFTTANGVAMIAPIKPGTYAITEVHAAPGYATAADVPIIVTNSNTSSNPAKGSMADAPLALAIIKLDGEKQKPIGGGIFKLMDGDSIVKVSPISGKPGWYRPDGGGDESFVVPKEGVTIAYLPEKAYTLVEVSAPAGYAISVESTAVTIDQTHTYDVPAQTTVENAPHIVTVAKSDGANSAPLPGVSFCVEDESGEPLRFVETGEAEYAVDPSGETQFFTGKDGIATLRLIPEGEYTLVETNNPGFGKVESVPFIVAKDNTHTAPVAIGVENFPLFFALLKVDKISSKPLKDVRFKMTGSDGKPLHFTKQENGAYKVTETGDETFATNEAGRAIISYIPVGVYTLTEQEYDGYGILAPAQVVILEDHFQDAPAAIKLENTPLAAEITKIDGYNKQPLSGVEFKLMKDGKLLRMALMSDGTYRPASTIEKISTQAEPAGKDDTTATVAFVAYSDTLKTDKNGRIRIEYLNLGAYTLEEQVCTGYVRLMGLEFVMQSAHTLDKPLQYTVENIPTRLLLEKQHALTREPLKGAKFSLKNADGKKVSLLLQADGVYRPVQDGETGVDIFALDKNAKAAIAYLPAGKYTVTEEEAPKGFALIAPIQTEVGTEAMLELSKEFSIAETSLAIANLPLALRITKVHAKTQKPLQGAAFQLKMEVALTVPLRFTLKDGMYFYDEAGGVTTIEMDKNAQAMIYNLPVGKYVLEESVVPEHFFPAAPVQIEITSAHSSDAPYEVVVANSPTVKLGIDSDQFNLVISLVAIALGGGIATVVILRRHRKIKK